MEVENIRFFGGEECRANPNTFRPQHQSGGNAAAIRNPSGTQYWRIANGIHYLRNQCHGAHRRVVTTAVVTLCHDNIETRRLHLNRVSNRAYHRHHLGAVCTQFIHPRPRVTQAGCVYGNSLLDDHFHLSFKKLFSEERRLIVIKPSRLAARLRRLQTFFAHKFFGKGLTLWQQVAWRRTVIVFVVRPSYGSRQQGIDTEGLVRHLAGLTNPFSQLTWTTGSSPKHTETTRIGHGGSQCRATGTAHACQHDGLLNF